MNDKEIARYALSFIGGTPTIHRYYNESEDKSVDVMCCNKNKYTNTNVFSTIGLSNFDAGVGSEDKSVRVELIGITNSEVDDWDHVMASTAFEVIDGETLEYGMVIQNVVREYIKNSILEHVVLVSPVYWDSYAPLVDDEISVSWLLVLPISEYERRYIEKNGIESFESLLADCDFNVLDLKRASLVVENTDGSNVESNKSMELQKYQIDENGTLLEYKKLK